MNNRPLQAKDLMLGDWVMWGYTTASGVKVGGFKMQVAAVYQDDLVDLIDSDSLYEQVPMDEVEAIPLTEGILKKNAKEVAMQRKLETVKAMMKEDRTLDLDEAIERVEKVQL